MEYEFLDVKLQMNYKLSTINFPKTRLEDIYSLQRDNVCCDLKLVFISGCIWIHRTALEMSRVWWTSLLRDSSTNVVMLPCESRVEVEKFVGTIYGRDLDLSLDEPFHGFTDKEKDTARKLNPFCKYLNPSILNVVNLFPN